MDQREHIKLSLARTEADRIAREADIHLHMVALRFIRGEASRKELHDALGDADAATGAAEHLNKAYIKSWKAIVDETIPG